MHLQGFRTGRHETLCSTREVNFNHCTSSQTNPTRGLTLTLTLPHWQAQGRRVCRWRFFQKNEKRGGAERPGSANKTLILHIFFLPSPVHTGRVEKAGVSWRFLRVYFLGDWGRREISPAQSYYSPPKRFAARTKIRNPTSLVLNPRLFGFSHSLKTKNKHTCIITVGPNGIRMSKSRRFEYSVTLGSSSQARHEERSLTVPSRWRLMLIPSSVRTCRPGVPTGAGRRLVFVF